MGELAVIPEAVVRTIMTRQLAFDAVRAAFESVAADHAKSFDVVIGTGLKDGELFALKSGLDKRNELVGFKCGSYWAGNHDKGLPAHGSTILLLDPETGFPGALISAAYLNGFRTAAADAVAVDSLAREDASVLGVIGAGHQAEHEIRAVAEVRALERIKVFTRSESRANWLAGRLQDLDIELHFTNAEDAVREADIVVTVTPSQSPIVMADWVGDGAHVSAMGADAKGKQELDTGLLRNATLFADNPEQSVAIGEFQHASAEGIASSGDIRPIGQVTLGNVAGRTSPEEITVFDSSGIAVQDLAVGDAVYEAAREAGQLRYIDF